MPKQHQATKKQKKSKAKATSNTQAQGRLRKHLASRRGRKVEARQTRNKITGSFRLFADTASLIRQHWKIFGGILLIYLVLSIALIGVRGSGLDVNKLKDQLSGSSGQLGINLTLFSLVAGSSGSPSSESGAAYQSIVLLIISLATVWALRQVMAHKKIRLRDTFYKGMYPLIPVMLVTLVVGIQLLPLMLSGFLAGVGFSGGVAVGLFEQILWAIAIFLLVLLSFYLICSSLFAFYVVTLPNMGPMAALRSARQLVRFRRWTIMRKILFLPLALLVLGAAITLPFIWLVPVLAQWVFIIASMVGLIFAHAYLYSLYRELL